MLRLPCIECAGSTQKATRCDDGDCPLWDYRTGHRPKGYRAKRTPMRALRAYCLWCCEGSRHEVRLCPVTACPLWPWRRGQSRVGDIALPPTPKPAPETGKHRRRRQSGARQRADELWRLFERRVPELASRLGVSGLTARIPQRWLPKVHGFVSLRCPHWYGGWCKRDGLSDDVRARAECPFKGWNAKRGERCMTPPCPAEVGLTELRCSGCFVMQAEAREWLEANLLASAPEEAILGYAARTLGAPQDGGN